MKRMMLITLLGLATAGAGATEIEGNKFASSYDAGGSELRLHATALLKAKVFFKVYVAGLYLSEKQDASRVLDDVPKRLEIAYLRDIPAKILIDAAENHFAANFKPAELAKLRERLDAINKLYTDVKQGDRYALTYRPGAGCELALNGRPLGTIPGADFAAAYFSIWLGQDCARPDFRDSLLGVTKQ